MDRNIMLAIFTHGSTGWNFPERQVMMDTWRISYLSGCIDFHGQTLLHIAAKNLCDNRHANLVVI
jgi:hypothetical protein